MDMKKEEKEEGVKRLYDIDLVLEAVFFFFALFCCPLTRILYVSARGYDQLVQVIRSSIYCTYVVSPDLLKSTIRYIGANHSVPTRSQQ